MALQTEVWRGTQERLSDTNTPQSRETRVPTPHKISGGYFSGLMTSVTPPLLA